MDIAGRTHIGIYNLISQLNNHLLFNTNFITDNGLYYGKTGAMIYLYHYGMFAHNNVLSSFGDEILLNVIGTLNNYDISYTNGLTGIGRAVHYLVEAGFIETSQDEDIFGQIDIEIIKHEPFLDIDINSIGISSYLLDKLKPQNIDSQNDLSTLLQLERLINHIEQIGLNRLIPKPINYSEFCMYFQRDNQFHALQAIIDRILIALRFLSKSFQKHIFPEGAKNVINDLCTKHHILFENFLRLIENIRYADGLPILNILGKMCLISLENQNSPFNQKNLEKVISYFTKFVWNISKIKPYSYNFHVEMLLTISKLNRILHSCEINFFANNYLFFLTKQMEKSKYLSSFYNTRNPNIGLSGLAGLGLVMLSMLTEDFTWEKLYLIS